MSRTHQYTVAVRWTGADGGGTTGYRAYRRDVVVSVEGKPPIEASADRPFFGDPARWNPEELLLAALAECHLLSYLAICAREGVVVTGYADRATATMATEGWTGRFTEAVLHPVVTVAEPGMVEQARALHHDAQAACFIANSVNFPVRHEPEVAAAT